MSSITDTTNRLCKTVDGGLRGGAAAGAGQVRERVPGQGGAHAQERSAQGHLQGPSVRPSVRPSASGRLYRAIAVSKTSSLLPRRTPSRAASATASCGGRWRSRSASATPTSSASTDTSTTRCVPLPPHACMHACMPTHVHGLTHVQSPPPRTPEIVLPGAGVGARRGALQGAQEGPAVPLGRGHRGALRPAAGRGSALPARLPGHPPRHQGRSGRMGGGGGVRA